jgi:hypothetical protein
MIPFEVTAIDLILTIAVIILVVLYWTKLSKIPDKNIFRGLMERNTNFEKIASKSQSEYSECPRGFGNIRKINDSGDLSERCLNCYKILECYGKKEENPSLINDVY